MTIEQRLDRIEENIASLTEAQRRTQSQLNQVVEQVDQMSSRVDQFVYHTQRLFTKAGTAIEKVEGTTETLEAIVRRLDRSHREMQSQQQEFRITTNASLEQITQVTNYLLRNTNPDSNNS